MSCSKCDSNRIVSLSAKCSDLCFASMTVNGKQVQEDGYVPSDMGVGGGDYLEIDLCLDCGQVQGEWPKGHTDLEEKAEEPEDDDD